MTGALNGKNLLLNTTTADSTTTGARKTFNEVLNGKLPDVAVIGDFFNQSSYFRRNGVGLQTSQLFINNTPITPQPLEPELIYNENLIALGNNQ